MYKDMVNSRSNRKLKIHSLKGNENLNDNLSPLLNYNHSRIQSKNSQYDNLANNLLVFTQKQSQTEFDAQETQRN